MDTARILKGARILILFPHMVTPGGAANYSLRLAGELAEQGAQVAILVLREKRGEFDVPSGVEVISLGGPLTSSLCYWLLFPFWQARINRTIAAWRPDVLVSQVFPSNWWGWLYKQRHPGTRMVWVCHEPSAFIHSAELIDGLKPFWKRWLAKCLQPLLKPVDLRLARLADRVVANSRYTAGQFERVYGRTVDGIACPGIDLDLFFPDGGPRERAIITVAHLVPYKRIDFLLRVFVRIREHYPGLDFHVVGEGPEAGGLQLLARELGIADSVIFHGRLQHAELAALNRRMLLFLFAGVNETFGMAPLEAIASGTPVVAHNSGGPREFVNDNCGRLVASLGVEDWVREVSAYLDDLLAQKNSPEKVSTCARNFAWRHSLRPAIEVVAGLCGGSKSKVATDFSPRSP